MDDIARQLPDPPPARPAARAATIAAALAKFDGEPAPAKATTDRPVRWQISRGPAAAFASVVVVALIGIPVAFLKPNDRVAGPPAPVTLDAQPQPQPAPARDRLPVQAPAPPAKQAVVDTPAERRAPPPTAATEADNETPVVEVSPPPPAPIMAEPAPPPPPPPASPPPMGFTAAPQAKAAPSAPVARNAVADSAREDIVVTGARVSQAARMATRRGDWNACTVDDPARSLRGCGAARRARKSEAGVALSDGLAKAWQGDWDAAIAAFDAAIALEPKLGSAYLNRGLVYWRAGDVARATADLDLAVRYAPSARSYYNRAQVRRATGDRRGARADEARALELDPDYPAVLDP